MFIIFYVILERVIKNGQTKNNIYICVFLTIMNESIASQAPIINDQSESNTMFLTCVSNQHEVNDLAASVLLFPNRSSMAVLGRLSRSLRCNRCRSYVFCRDSIIQGARFS